jgi:multidrug efflux system outer membrane protein
VQGATLQGLTHEQEAHAAAVDASRKLAANAEARMQRGLADRNAVLQAKQALLRQEEIRLQQQDAELQAEVALTKALGGGYTTTSTQ